MRFDWSLEYVSNLIPTPHLISQYISYHMKTHDWIGKYLSTSRWWVPWSHGKISTNKWPVFCDLKYWLVKKIALTLPVVLNQSNPNHYSVFTHWVMVSHPRFISDHIFTWPQLHPSDSTWDEWSEISDFKYTPFCQFLSYEQKK